MKLIEEDCATRHYRRYTIIYAIKGSQWRRVTPVKVERDQYENGYCEHEYYNLQNGLYASETLVDEYDETGTLPYVRYMMFAIQGEKFELMEEDEIPLAESRLPSWWKA